MPLTVSTSGVIEPDVASLTHNGVFYRCYVWNDEESNQIGTACFVEQEQGQDVVLWSRKMLSDGAGNDTHTRPKVVAQESGSTFVVFWVSFDDPDYELWYGTIDVSDLQSNPDWSVAELVKIHADSLFDIANVAGSDNFVLAYKNTGGTINVGRRSSPTVTVWTDTIADTPANCLGAYGHDADDDVLVSYEDASASRLRTFRYDASDGANVANDYTSDGTAREFYQVGHARITSSITAVVAEGRTEAENADYRYLFYQKVSNADCSTSQNAHRTYLLSMMSKPWVYASSNGVDVYCLAGFKSRMAAPNDWSQNNYYIVNLDHLLWGDTAYSVQARAMCNINLGTAQGHHSTNNQASHVSGAPGWGPDIKVRVPAAIEYTRMTMKSEKGRGALVPGNPRVVGYFHYPEDPWLQFRDDDDPTDPTYFESIYPFSQFQNFEAGRALVVGGGTPWEYDGAQPVENGFAWWPEILSLTPAAGGSLTASSTYWYTAVYEWRDNIGRLHRSAPAIPVSTTLTAAQTLVTIVTTYLTLTQKMGASYPDAQNVEIVHYRTLANGSLFYRVSSTDGGASPNWNSTTLSVDTFADTVADTTIDDHELLPYQVIDGQWVPLPNYQPPSLCPIALWKDRVIGCNTLDPGTLWASMPILPEGGGVQLTALEWNPVLTLRIDDGGQPTGLCAMDHALIVFKQDMIFAVVGDWPDNTGTRGNIDYQKIASGIGCSNPKSVILGADGAGVYFQSEKGIYLLTRTFEVQYIGAPIEDKVRSVGNIRSATLLADRHQIRFLGETSGGTRYVFLYDYFMKQWGWFELLSIDSTTAADRRVIDSTSWRGYENNIEEVILTQGMKCYFERYDGTDYADHDDSGTNTLVPMEVVTGWVKVGELDGFYKLRSIVLHVQKANSSALKVQVGYDYSTSYTDTFTWSGSSDEPLRIRPSRAKITAFRLRVTDENDPGTGENIKLTGFGAEVFVKRGHRKLQDSYIGA